MTTAKAVARAMGWPFRWLLTRFITFYRSFISPMLGPRCKYHPSCSAYALHAIETHGAAKGTALASWRLLRCNPFSKGGYDPVPAPGSWLPDIYPDGKPRKTASGETQPPAPFASKEA